MYWFKGKEYSRIKPEKRIHFNLHQKDDIFFFSFPFFSLCFLTLFFLEKLWWDKVKRESLVWGRNGDEEPKKSEKYSFSFTQKEKRNQVVARKAIEGLREISDYLYKFLISEVVHIPSKIQWLLKYMLYKVILCQITPLKMQLLRVGINSSCCGYVYAYSCKDNHNLWQFASF